MSSSSDTSILSQKRIDKLSKNEMNCKEAVKHELQLALKADPEEQPMQFESGLKLKVQVPVESFDLDNLHSPALTLPTKALQASPKSPQQAIFASLAPNTMMHSDSQPVLADENGQSCALSKSYQTVRRNSCQFTQQKNMNVKRLYPDVMAEEVKSAAQVNPLKRKRIKLAANFNNHQVESPIVTIEDEKLEKANKCCVIDVHQMDNDSDDMELKEQPQPSESPRAIDYLMVNKQIGCTPNLTQQNQFTVAGTADEQPQSLFVPIKLNVQRKMIAKDENGDGSCVSMSDGSSILGGFNKTAVNLTFGLPQNRCKKDDSLLAIDIDSTNGAAAEQDFMLVGSLDIKAENSATA